MADKNQDKNQSKNRAEQAEEHDESVLNPEIKNFYDFTTDDLIVENYETWPQIKNIPVAI